MTVKYIERHAKQALGMRFKETCEKHHEIFKVNIHKENYEGRLNQNQIKHLNSVWKKDYVAMVMEEHESVCEYLKDAHV